MPSLKTIFICSNCGYESLKWLGKCPSCESWNTMAEEVVETRKKKEAERNTLAEILTLEDNTATDSARINTGIKEFDRVLGGGLMPGSAVLIGGDPGIGKSTLVMQAAAKIKEKVLYATGEESINQLRLRANRLKLKSDSFFIIAETDLNLIEGGIENVKPTVIIIDSIQTVYKPELDNPPGTVTQIRECTNHLMNLAKKNNLTCIFIGHVTKEGFIAGPKVLEHIVDTVLYFEGERRDAYRILRAQKNRFGSTNEIGIFEMTEGGLNEVINPSKIFLSDRDKEITGSAVTASIEGTRPVLLEVQALVTPTNFGNPQRVATGFDYRRLSILLAVLEKRANLRLSNQNVFLNMAGGIKIDEPAVDLAVCTSIVSSLLDKPVKKDCVVIGEVGLGGEIRAVGNIDKRLQEALKLGFKSVVIPRNSGKNVKNFKDIEIFQAESVTAALRFALGHEQKNV